MLDSVPIEVENALQHRANQAVSEERKSGPLKHCEGPRKYDIKDPKDHQEILRILTPEYMQHHAYIMTCTWSCWTCVQKVV